MGSYKGGRPTENWCPVYVGDDEAMMKRLREVEMPKGSRIYRVQQESPMQNGGYGQLDQGGFFEAPKPEGGWKCVMQRTNPRRRHALHALIYPKKPTKLWKASGSVKRVTRRMIPLR